MSHPIAFGRWRSLAIATLAAALPVGCHYGVTSNASTSVACPAAVAPRADWQPVMLGAFTIRIPATFARETGLLCYHGGEYYVDRPSRLGYCNGRFGIIAPTNAPHEQQILFLGAPALLTCARNNGRWIATVVSVGSDIRFVMDAEASDEARLGLLIGILENAAPHS
jgi:hypothetical protein